MHAAGRAFVLFTIVAASYAHARAAHAVQPVRDWRHLADEMVDKEIVAAGVKNDRVIRAMRDTPRHEFVLPNERDHAYLDMALPIGNSQTISPPFVVASMSCDWLYLRSVCRIRFCTSPSAVTMMSSTRRSDSRRNSR